MNDEHVIMPHEEAVELICAAFEHLADWPIKKAETFRNAILGDGVFAVNPLLDLPDENSAGFIKDMIKSTIAQGCMIDFGYMPNEFIKQESVRSRDMFEANEFIHPYDSWFAVSWWEGGCNGYHISPHPIYPNQVLIIELYGLSMQIMTPPMPAVILYDIISLEIRGGNTHVMPFNMNYPDKHQETPEELNNRGANSLDPLVTMLRLLADASIDITHVDEPVKLNKVRLKQGKHYIPGHSIVHTKDYVANFQVAKASKSNGKNGHHASPIAHWRRAHLRHYQDGKVVPVKSSKVNWREAEELHRMFYRMK